MQRGGPLDSKEVREHQGGYPREKKKLTAGFFLFYYRQSAATEGMRAWVTQLQIEYIFQQLHIRANIEEHPFLCITVERKLLCYLFSLFRASQGP